MTSRQFKKVKQKTNLKKPITHLENTILDSKQDAS